MMKKYFPYFLTALLLLSGQLTAISQEKKVTITVDDLPTVIYADEPYEERLELTKRFTEFFSENEIPAIGFVNEKKVYAENAPDPKEVKLLELWYEHGLELGNHTFSHMNYNQNGFDAFTADMLKGEKVMKEVGGKYNQPPVYLRHPYLRSGKTQGQSDSLLQFLDEQDYKEAPVTLDNGDYLFAVKYEKARNNGDKSEMKKISEAYLEYTADQIDYYEQLTTHVFDRQVPQVFLMHINWLNADVLEELASLFRSKGYAFVSLAESLEDEAYDHPITRYGDWGISWLERWALSDGDASDLMKASPTVPEFILE